MNYNQCAICLETYSSMVVSVNAADENNVKWFTMLQFIIPELEWLEEYLICQSCAKHLEGAWQFKNLVLNLETQRRLLLTKREDYADESHDSKDNCESDSSYTNGRNITTCELCSRTFTTLNQLRQHKLQIHCGDYSTCIKEEQADDIFKDNKDSNLFWCNDCGNSFNTKNGLLYHIGNEHGETKLCIICEKFCLNREKLETHMREEHGSKTNEDYTCSLCFEKFTSDLVLNVHFRTCKSKFHCPLCQESFTAKKVLNSHLKVCKNKTDGKSRYQCGTCQNFYTTEKNLNLHKLWCTKDPTQGAASNFNCDICSLEFTSLLDHNAHKNSAHKEENNTDKPPSITKKRKGRKSLKVFTCEICSEQFSYAKLVIEHCVSIHTLEEKCVKPYSCDKCAMRFASSANLDQHRNYHEKNRTHICSLCGKGFITKSDLTVHEYTHFNRRNYKCNECDKAFNTNKNLRTHHLVVHTDRSLWKYGCSICEKRFPLKTNYEQHLRRHTGEKKYICHICKKPFISKSEMQRHINLHSNIRNFKCSNCDKEYKERRTYLSHLTRVHGIGNAKVTVREKKFVCHICPSQFYDQQKLARHLCSHSGLKPFPCYVCDKKFTDKSYLKHHLKTAHDVVELLNIE